MGLGFVSAATVTERIIGQVPFLCKRVIYTASFHTGFAKMWDVAV
jgi:hypothetical protein